ncbi:unnamed protein product [Rotaria sordida]|uniref:Uncharacterized protein n=2 Tax=Rotaria sordida TaxID=392033 RepID=A0A819W6F5_9BILA|nr:unnamed protein product [Rotaria sordida]CAF4057127.1 unnamed protein product [Rotaria sordida]CAF4119466.1 unnamed protein product [Rotaria sordida]
MPRRKGCCGFCKPPPQIQQQTATTIYVEKDEEKKKKAFGFIEIYPGVRTSDDKYTCPMLAIHLYRHSLFKGNMAEDKRTVTVDYNNEQQAYQGPRELTRAAKLSAEEELIMLPVEDIILISTKTEIEAGIAADVKAEIEPIYKLSENCCDRCCDSILNCCRKTCDFCGCCRKETKVVPFLQKTTTILYDQDPNQDIEFEEEHLPIPEVKEGCCTSCCNCFRCWCCRIKVLVDRIKRTKTVKARNAKRVITIKIEYSKYSNPDTPSNARLLNAEQQAAYYNQKFERNKELEFYLVSNEQFDSDSFKQKSNEFETFCRTVMHLKAMRNHYPSDTELEQILGQRPKTAIGDAFDEEKLLNALKEPPKEGKDSRNRGLPQSPKPLDNSQKRPKTPDSNKEP